VPRFLKIFFHDNCLDGAASAALFADFYRARHGGDVTVSLQGVQHKQGDPFAGLALDADDNACVDFRFSPSPRMNWWFDHHVSAFQPPELRAQFEADRSGQKFYDPEARSCTKFEAQVLARDFGYGLPEAFGELVHWADIIDGAQFPTPAMAVELAEPALQLMTWIENNGDPALTHRFIGALGHRPLAAIAAEPWVTEPLRPLLDAHRRNLELIRSRARCDRGVIFFDLTGDPTTAYNKFIPYYLFPGERYTVGVTRTESRVKISVGSNPWARETRTHNIAAICERYGGGGHPVVGAVSLPEGEVEKTRQIAAEIAAELRS
jgi:hypothetical protein